MLEWTENIYSHTRATFYHFKLVSHSPKWLRDTDNRDLFSFSFFVSNVQRQTHNNSDCDSRNHSGENVCLFVKQKSLTESISRQEKERILDSIKVTASPIGTPLTGPLFTQTVCLCMAGGVGGWVSVWVYLKDELISHHPAQGHQALLRVYTKTQLKI